MTPPDHTPYLRPGVDLCTAEDVLAWMAERTLAWVPEYPGERMPAGTLVRLLRARLNRERRQACRRAAVDAWERFAGEARSWGRYPEWAASMGAAVWDGTGDAVRAQCAERMLRDLALALAFRAAARAR